MNLNLSNYLQFVIAIFSSLITVLFFQKYTNVIMNYTFFSINVTKGILSNNPKNKSYYESNTSKKKAVGEINQNPASAFKWIKYGNDVSDWALVVNAHLCIERTRNKKSNLVIYSFEDINLKEVSFNPFDM